MAAATLTDLQTWIETYAGPILDAAMHLTDTGAAGGPIIVPGNASDRSPLQELAHRIAVARAATNLPAAYTSSPRATRAANVGQDWSAALADWLATWNYPNW